MKNTSRRQAFIYAYVAGFVHFVCVLYWVSFVSKLGAFFLILYLSLYWAFFGFFACRRLQFNFKNCITLSSLWIVLEFIRGKLLGGFGWAYLGYSQFNNLALIQISDIFGVSVISFLIVYVNFFLFNLIFSGKDKYLVFKHCIYICVVLLLTVFYGLVSIEKYSDEYGKKITVSLVQPNIAQEMKWDPSYSSGIVEVLKSFKNKLPKESLVVFPEASWPYVVNDTNIADLERFAEFFNRDFIIGAVQEENNKFYNTSIFISKESRVKDIYRKIKLVPFGEYVPFRRFLSFIEVLNSIGDIEKGNRYSLFSFKDAQIANLICFEDIFSDLVLQFVRRGANLLLNITNDAWFRGHPQAVQHLQIAVFRAIETRRYLVRVANTGISCVISAKGKILHKIEEEKRDVFLKDTLSEEVFLRDDISLYAKIGDVFVLCAFLFLMGDSLIGRRLLWK